MEGNKRHGGRKHALFTAAFAAFGLLAAPAASAFDFSFSDDDLGWGNWGQVDFTWNTRLTAGAQVRTERRDYRLVDKQNNPANWDIPVEGRQTNFLFPSPIDAGPFSGTFDLCEIGMPGWFDVNRGNFGASDCASAGGDPRPSQRLINAPGGYNINGDDGNLNYDRGDVTYANLQVRSELTAFWRNFSAKLSGIGYYDPVNNDFETHLADRSVLEYSGRTFPVGAATINTYIYPLHETITVDRSDHAQRRDDLEDRLGEQLRLLEAYVAGDFDLAGRTLRLAVGDQRMRWGESTFMIFNNLARINPPSAELYDRPGTEVRDAFIPVGMVTASMNVTTNFNVEAFYQYDWEPVEPSICGSFLSVSDVAGCGDGPTPIYLAAGNAPEAPNADFRLGGLSGNQTHTSRTIYLEDEAFGYPDDGGQFGLRLDYYADWLNGGTELSLYGMNIHSRLPFFSALAAECEWGAYSDFGGPDGLQCPGYDPDDYADNTDRAAATSWRVDSMRGFLDYPEDIGIFGLSATTNFGDWSLAGELAYSPNQPAQVSVVDVVYAGIQPALLRTPLDGPYGDDIDIELEGSNLANLRQTPRTRIFAPDYLQSRYRCNINEFDSDWENERACSEAIGPGDYIRGYERLKVGQISMTGIRVLGSSSPISAALNSDQIIFVSELAAYKAFDMPGLNELQFQGSGAKQTHYSQGQADWDPEVYGHFRNDTGEPVLDANGDPILPDGYSSLEELCNDVGCSRKLGPTDRANPERADEDIFADDFAWGYRMRITADYNNGPLGWKWTPGLLFYHDVHGTSISPGQDFVEDRKELTLSTNILFTNEFSANLQYRFYWGAGDRNLRQDRDYAEFALNYSF